MRWDLFGGAIIAMVVLAWLWQVRKKQWSWTGLYASIGFLVIAWLNAAAPFRGLVDPDYVGFSMGKLQADKGIAVTLVAGSALLISIIAALIAASRMEGRALWFVAAASLYLLVMVGLPISFDILGDPSQFNIQLGEYLTIPGMIAILIINLLVTLPLLVALFWSVKSARAR